MVKNRNKERCKRLFAFVHVCSRLFRKILVSVKFFVRNSGAGNGCANFMGPWKNAFFLQDKAMSIKFLVLGGVFWFFFVGGGECRFYFYGREDFSDKLFFCLRFRLLGGRACLEEGRLGLPGEVWELRFLPSFAIPKPSGKTSGSPRHTPSIHLRPSEPLHLLAFVSVCQRLFAFARICLRPPLSRPPLRDTEN